ncbi:MAG TPA: UpxY family transcription antiterminator [Puia sp.]|jgi:transcription elongation factor/antiterminator RfaH
MSYFATGWYLLYTRPHQEQKVVAELNDNDVQVYLPYMKVRKQWSDRIKTVRVPLFPSYVFVYLRNLQEFFTCSSVEGAYDYVRCGKEAARVREEVIDSVRMIEQGENLELSDEYFNPGEKVQILQGPLCGLTCEVVRKSGKDKIMVRVNLLKQFILADLPVSDLTECISE